MVPTICHHYLVGSSGLKQGNMFHLYDVAVAEMEKLFDESW
jgi:hypothetical protein